MVKNHADDRAGCELLNIEKVDLVGRVNLVVLLLNSEVQHVSPINIERSEKPTSAGSWKLRGSMPCFLRLLWRDKGVSTCRALRKLGE